MILAVALVWQVVWWFAIATFVFLIVPVVVLLANRLVWAAREIRDYADDVLAHGIAIAGNLDPVPELERTRELVKEVRGPLERYTKSLGRLTGEGR